MEGARAAMTSSSSTQTQRSIEYMKSAGKMASTTATAVITLLRPLPAGAALPGIKEPPAKPSAAQATQNRLSAWKWPYRLSR